MEAVRRPGGVMAMAAAGAVKLVVVVVVEGGRRTEPTGRHDGPASEEDEAMRKLGMNSTQPRQGDRSAMVEMRSLSLDSPVVFLVML